MSGSRARSQVSPLALSFLLAFVTLIPEVPLWAQSPEGVAPESSGSSELRAFYLPTVALGGDEESLRFAGIIDEALRRELELLGLQVVVAEAPSPESREEVSADPDPAASLGTTLETARGEAATIVVGSSAYVQRRELVMTFRAIDVASERLIAATFTPTLVGVTVHNRIDEAVTQLAARLEEFLANPEERASIAPFALSVTVQGSPEEMEVSFPGEEPLGRLEDGELTFPFEPYPVGSRLLLEKSHPDYHDELESVQLNAPVNNIELDPLWKKTRWAGELSWTYGQLAGLGVGARYFFDPDYWFVSGENYFYLQPSPYENANTTYHNDLFFWTGRYLFFDYDSPFRLGMGIGLGLILTRVADADRALFTDFYLNLANLWIEYNTPTWTYSFRVGTKISMGIGNNLLETGYVSVTDPSEEGPELPPLTFAVGRKF